MGKRFSIRTQIPALDSWWGNTDTHTARLFGPFPESVIGMGLGSKGLGVIWPGETDIGKPNGWVLPPPFIQPET